MFRIVALSLVALLAGCGAAPSATKPATVATTAAPATSAPAAATKPAATTAPAKPAAVAPTATTKPEPQLLKIGDVLEAPNWHLKVVTAERVDGDLVWSQYGNKTKAIGQWLVLTLELKNVGRENFSVHQHDFELQTANGQTIKHSSEVFGYADFKGQVALGKQIPPGATVVTPLIYDIPQNTNGINLIFAQAKNKPINVG